MDINNDRYVVTPVGFTRVNREPLEKYEVFNSTKELKNYILNGPLYDSQVCAVNINDDLSLQYLIKKNNRVTVYYPDSNIDFDTTLQELIAKYDIKLNCVVDSLNLGNNYPPHPWRMIYDAKAGCYVNSSTPTDYLNKSDIFSALCNLDLYKINNNFYFMLVINGEIKYSWSSTVNFMTVSGSGLDFKKTSSNYLYTLYNGSNNTGYGLFPINSDSAINDISLFVRCL